MSRKYNGGTEGKIENGFSRQIRLGNSSNKVTSKRIAGDENIRGIKSFLDKK